MPEPPSLDAVRLQGEDGAVFFLMRRAMQLHNARWAAALPQLTKVQWAVLRTVREQPGLDQGTVGSVAAVDKATMASLVARLVERGWLDLRPDPADRRRRLLHLTGAGGEVVRGAEAVAAEVDACALASLTADDRSVLRGLLGRLA